jgi:hypothetical protein
MPRHWHGCNFGLIVGILILAPNPAWADDLSTQPFEVRLWAAMSRSVSSTDAIGRQASVAYLSASSDNPSGIDVRDAEGENVDRFICAGTHHVLFSNGAWIAAGDANGLMRMKKGSVLFGYNHIELADGETQQGFDDDFRTNEFVIKYGRQIQTKAYIGVGFRVREMKLDYGDLYLGAPRNTQNDSIGGSFTLGGVWRPNRNWTLGVLTEAGWIHSDIQGNVHLPGPVNIPFQLDLMTKTVNVKTGLAWKILPVLTIYGDGQYYHLGNSMTTVDLGRFYFGGDIRIGHGIYLMAGGSVDTMEQVSESVGISIAMSKPRLIKVTYQHNPLPEIRQEFGTGHLVSASVVFSF